MPLQDVTDRAGRFKKGNTPVQLEVVGFFAGTLTTFYLFPQTIKIMRTRDTKAISLAAELTLMLGCGLWAVYGVLIGSPSVITFNTISSCFTASIVLLKLRFH